MSIGRVVLAWRELESGGGIGTYVRALTHHLAGVVPLTVITGAEQNLAGLLPESVEVLTVRAPTDAEIASKACEQHAYSVLLWEAYLERFADDPPALIEFSDYGAEGLATLQARQAAHPALRETRCVVRLNTTGEMVAVLDGAVPMNHASRQRYAAEERCLQLADVLLHGGGEIAAAYERFYGATRLAPRELVRQPLQLEAVRDPWPEGERLELLYLGRLERRKGVDLLGQALQQLPRDDVRLTFLGGDTATAPLGSSMGDALSLLCARDSRIRVLPALPPKSAEMAELLRQTHAVVMPSRWECWPATALEAFAANRPVIAPRVGGLAEMVEAPDAGCPIAAPRSAGAIADAITAFAEQREEWRAAVNAGGPARRFEALADPRPVVDWYRRAAERPGGRAQWRRPPAERPLVTVAVPYYAAHRWVEATLQAVRAQTYPHIELVLLVDGTFGPHDRMVAQMARTYGAELLSQPNAGVGAGRNLMTAVARGRYVMFMDADNLITPEFIARGVDLLERDPSCGFFTSWLASIDHRGEPLGTQHGYWPLGHDLAMLDDHNVAGDAAMLVRRSLFAQGLAFATDLATFEDYDFYRQLRDAGVGGAVYPAQMLRYRVRPDSNSRVYGHLHVDRTAAELRAHRREDALFA